MSRTTDADVKAVLAAGRNYDTVGNPSVTPYITTASAVTDRLVTAAAAKGYTLTAEQLELIERWLACHYYTRSDPTYKSRSTAGGSGSFNADGSEYMNAALDLDPTGLLVSILKKKTVATGGWLGKPPSQQIPYDQRD